MGPLNQIYYHNRMFYGMVVWFSCFLLQNMVTSLTKKWVLIECLLPCLCNNDFHKHLETEVAVCIIMGFFINHESVVSCPSYWTDRVYLRPAEDIPVWGFSLWDFKHFIENVLPRWSQQLKHWVIHNWTCVCVTNAQKAVGYGVTLRGASNTPATFTTSGILRDVTQVM